MKKAIIAIAVLLIAGGISIGAFLYVKSDSDKKAAVEQSESADKELLSFDSKSINKVAITCPDGNYTVELNGETWILTEYTGTPFDVNQTTVQGICTFMSNLTAIENYGEITDEKKQTYGLNNPYVVTAYSDSDSYTLYLGDKSPTGNYYYGYPENKNNIYGISASDGLSIITSRLGLKDNKIIPYKTEEIVGMELVRDGEIVYTFTYDSENNRWKLPEKYDMLTIDQTKVNEIITILTRLTAEVMLPEDENDFTTYGFDKPIAEFTIKSSDGSQKTLLFSKYGQDAVTYTHVYNKEAKQVETFYAGDLDFIEKNPADFIMKTFECSSMYSVREFEVISEDVNVKFTVNASEGWAEFDGNRLDLTNASIEGYFKNFFNHIAYVSIEDIDVDISPEFTEPLFTAKFKDLNDKESQIDFVGSEESDLCYIFINGEYTGTLTNSEFISGKDSVSAAFDLLCEQAGIEK